MKKLSFVMITLFLSIFFLFSNNVDAARLNCWLFRWGTDTATNMIASPNPPESVADTNAACITYCDQSWWTNGDKCIRWTTVIKTYSSVTPWITSSWETLWTYIWYMNWNVFITTKNITRESAYDNCKLNATNNPNASVKCTWNWEEIFTNEQKWILEMYVNNNLKIRDIAITKDYSYTNCNNYSQSNPTSSVKCTWNNEVIFQSTTSSSNVDAIYELIKIMKDDLLNMGIMTQSEYIQMMSWYKNALYVSKLSPDSVYKTALSDNIQTKNNYYYQKINTLFIFAKTNGYITESMYSTINRKYYNVTIASSEDKWEYYYMKLR